jgi:hypothetical protein
VYHQRHLVAVRLPQLHRLVADLEGDEELPARAQDPGQLGEGGRQLLGRQVDERVPGERSRQGMVGEVERGHRSDVEAQVRVLAPSHPHHARREIHAPDIEPQRGKVCGDPAGATAQVGDLAPARDRDHLGEQAQHRPVRRTVGERVAEEVGLVVLTGKVGQAADGRVTADAGVGPMMVVGV